MYTERVENSSNSAKFPPLPFYNHHISTPFLNDYLFTFLHLARHILTTDNLAIFVVPVKAVIDINNEDDVAKFHNRNLIFISRTNQFRITGLSSAQLDTAFALLRLFV